MDEHTSTVAGVHGSIPWISTHSGTSNKGDFMSRRDAYTGKAITSNPADDTGDAGFARDNTCHCRGCQYQGRYSCTGIYSYELD